MTVTGSILTPSMKIKTIQEDIIAETLLSETGWFYLNDVFRVLDPEETGKYKLAFKQIERMIEKGEDPYEVMGRNLAAALRFRWNVLHPGIEPMNY